ncbi:prepilin-type N-terminal cleavage/methylation domain-containing protein [Pseudoalteromonas sp. MB47]|uniref:prepilin-type N-terminal cleavage/methylation domain-containing protein n=1 Tax=Pseudoalteromonas sp. MB47 TaxID=2588452 RepID=UPI00140C1AF4|nr:prepilin-type N-terminal cleavage/methylation domain-containing protein [Pseudoalteromonas sp. MB47]NHH89254.1 Type II secretion system protein G [Pseudoalteromonas sp. MB47]
MYLSKSAGFTLVELLIVMVLIGLASSFVLPNMWQQLEQTKRYGERKQLIEAVKFAKQYSVYKGVELKINLSNNSLEITDLSINKSQNVKQAAELVQNEPNNPKNTAENTVLKKVTFETMTFENSSFIVSAKTYFKKLAIKATFDNKNENEIIEI